MSRGLLFAALTLFVTVSAHAIPVQWQVSSGGNGHFYDVVFSQQLLTWTDANTAALALPGGWHLATLTSSAESAFAESLLDPTQYTDCVSGTLGGTICTGVWIGALSSAIGSNDWQWVTGETFSYTDWGPFEPFSNGAEFASTGFSRSASFPGMMHGIPPIPLTAISWNRNRHKCRRRRLLFFSVVASEFC